jgi:hypothetical protein
MRQTFRHWHAEQESLEAQLAESLSALSAYQSHLDAWQQQLARERAELRKSGEQCEHDRSGAGAELEAARARELELKTELEEQKRVLEKERAEWAEKLSAARDAAPPVQQAPERSTAAAPQTAQQPDESPVLGSIMEQFGKLRQQRASDRQALKKTTR